MGQAPELYQQLIASFKTFLAEAEAVGEVEKYVLEVVVGKAEAGPALHTGLYAALLSLRHTLQEVLDSCYPEKKQKVAPSVTRPVAGQYEPEEGLPDLPDLPEDDRQDKAPSRHQSPPPPPTTKETEAANVLMNLSGKATERGAPPLIESCPTLHLPSPAKPPPCKATDQGATPLLESCPTLHLPSPAKPPPCPPGRKEPSGPCDEVPQINEKDLLPLATQVLCQLCSRQCEDLVELQEHVLGAHHAAEGQRKARLPLKLEEEGEASLGQQQEVGDAGTAMIVLVPPPPPPPSTSHNTGDRTRRKARLKRPNDFTTATATDTIQVQCVEAWPCSAVVGGSETLQPRQPDLPPALPTHKDQDFLRGQSGRSVTELTPLPGSDALAMAVESSQIRVMEAKVTVIVCLECSSGFTGQQDYISHACGGDRPLVVRSPDGAVTLADPDPAKDPPPQAPQQEDVRLFPEFFIQQLGDGSSLQMVHLSGRSLRLHTSCSLAYLGEHLIAFRCPTCENDSDSLSHFLQHLTAGPCMFRCPDCKLVYISPDKLKNHRASLHPSLEDRTCPNCQHVFDKRHQRNKHLKTQCSQRHQCLLCGRLLKNEYNLRVHMQSHQEERKHVCGECGAAFHRQAILTRHKMGHTRTKPHACPHCDAHFYTRQHLRTHLDRHNGVRRYPCSACTKAYYSKHDHDSHYSKVHCKPSASLKTLPQADVRQEGVPE